MAAERVIYIKAEQATIVKNSKVFLEDAVTMTGPDKKVISELGGNDFLQPAENIRYARILIKGHNSKSRADRNRKAYKNYFQPVLPFRFFFRRLVLDDKIDLSLIDHHVIGMLLLNKFDYFHNGENIFLFLLLVRHNKKHLPAELGCLSFWEFLP